MDISRDWCWAPEYVDAMWRMLQLEKPEDFVIATGETFILEEFVAHAFGVLGMNWYDHIVQDKSFYRPADILVSSADPSKAKRKLNWVAKIKGLAVVEGMLEL
jgi:GDPmannose 4,6-dehydratase